MPNGECGGWSDTEKATKEVQKISDQVKAQAEGMTNEKYVEFDAVTYRCQVVAGINYVIKVHVGGDKYLHLVVFLPCDGENAVLNSVEAHHHKDDPLKT